MIPDAELHQMKADAERMQALREKATPGPWKKTSVPSRLGAGLNACISSVTHSVMEVYGWHDADNAANADLVIATRTDPSAANVLRLVSEVERLRERLSFYVLNPSENTSFLYPEHFEKHGSNKTAVAEDIIDACHIHGVPVPPHLKPYEEAK